MKAKDKKKPDQLVNADFWKNEPKHAVLTRLLENQIQQMRPGDKLPGIRDLMRKFKICQSTIERAMQKLEARNLITRRWGSGVYVSPRGVQKKARHIIGVVVTDITDAFCALLFKGIEQKLTAQNHHAILCNGYRQFQAEVDAIRALEHKIDGAIINPTSGNALNPEYVRYFSELVKGRQFPFLFAGVMIPEVNAHFAGFDNFSAFSGMTRLLAGSRTRFGRIIYLGALESLIGAERINGFQAGIKENNIAEDKLKIVNVPVPVPEITLDPKNFQGAKPVVMVSASPRILPRLLAFCEAQRLRIPEDVVILSVVEENFRDYIYAPVIGWVKPSIRLGELAAGMIQALIAGKQVEKINKIALESAIPGALKHLF